MNANKLKKVFKKVSLNQNGLNGINNQMKNKWEKLNTKKIKKQK